MQLGLIGNVQKGNYPILAILTLTPVREKLLNCNMRLSWKRKCYFPRLLLHIRSQQANPTSKIAIKET